MSIEELVQNLEFHWDTDGFLGAVRCGNFDVSAGGAFLNLLRGITIGDDELVPKRLLSLLWYLPSFLEWQKERVADVARSEVDSYERFVTDVQNVLEEVLGVP